MAAARVSTAASSTCLDSLSRRAVSSAAAVWLANAMTAGTSASVSPGPSTVMAPMALPSSTSGAEISVWRWSSSLSFLAFPTD